MNEKQYNRKRVIEGGEESYIRVITVSNMRELNELFNSSKITFSRWCELINEAIEMELGMKGLGKKYLDDQIKIIKEDE